MADKKTDKYAEQMGELRATLHIHGEQLSGIHTEMKQMNHTLTANTEQLKIHIEGVEQTRKLIAIKEEEINNRLKPIEKHVTLVGGFMKLGMIFLGIPACVYYLIRIVKEFLVK